MQCPKCGGNYLEIHGTFDGTQKIEFGGGRFEIVDSEPTDFSWDDHDQVDCLDCGHEGVVREFEAKEETENA